MKNTIIQLYIMNYIISLKLSNIDSFLNFNFQFPKIFNYNIKYNVSTFESKYLDSNISYNFNIQEEHFFFNFLLKKVSILEPTDIILNTFMYFLMHYNFVLLPIFFCISIAIINNINLFFLVDTFRFLHNLFVKINLFYLL